MVRVCSWRLCQFQDVNSKNSIPNITRIKNRIHLEWLEFVVGDENPISLKMSIPRILPQISQESRM